jgi:hypothetical protein
MVEETKGIKVWQIAQTAIGGLVVASLLGLAGSLFALRDAVLKHDLQLERYESFINAGDRYTESDGNAERSARIQADAVMGEKISQMNANQVRMWTAIRNHISEGQHQGADYRLRSLEEHYQKEHR